MKVAGSTQRGHGGEVINALRGDAHEIDGIDGGEPDLAGEIAFGEQTFHDALGIVEDAFQRDIVDIGMTAGGHLAALHFADPAFGMQHKDFDIGKPAQRGDGRRAGIARGGRHNGGLAAAALSARGQTAAPISAARYP